MLLGRTVQVTPGTEYVLSFYYRYGSLPTGASCSISATYAIFNYFATVDHPSLDLDYHNFQGSFTPTTADTRISISVYCTSSSGVNSEFDIYVDDISVTVRKESCGSPDPVCPSAANLLTSPGFEPVSGGSQVWSASRGSADIVQNSVKARSGDYLALVTFTLLYGTELTWIGF